MEGGHTSRWLTQPHHTDHHSNTGKREAGQMHKYTAPPLSLQATTGLITLAQEEGTQGRPSLCH